MIRLGGQNFVMPLVLAPMAGYTDKPFRQLLKQKGADLLITEFVSSDAIIRSSTKTMQYLDFDASERPIGIQIFGDNPHVMGDAAKMIEERFQPDFIDINAGCWVRKVVRKNAGSALLKDLPLLERVARTVVQSVSIPVTAKIRAGWNSQSIVATEAARRLAEAGIYMLTLHPRTAVDGFKKPANWRLIADVKAAVNIPIIGNGDIKTPEDARRMLAETNCDGIAVGRGLLSSPWLFVQIRELFEKGVIRTVPTLSDKIRFCQTLLARQISVRGESFAGKEMKKFYSWILRGFSGAAELREKLVRAPSASECQRILAETARVLSGPSV